MPQLTIQQAFDLATQHHQAGRLAEAEGIYRQILAQQPEHAGAMHFLGVIAHQAGRNDVALDLIQRALIISPNYSSAQNNLGVVLKAQGKLEAAIVAWRRTIALDPNFVDAHNNLGHALRERGQFDSSIIHCEKAIALRLDFAEAYNNLGIALRDKGQIDKALAAWNRALACKPGFTEAHINIGNVMKDQGQLDQAIAAYRRAISSNPNSFEAHNNLGNALVAKGETEAAIVAYRNAISLNPNLPQVHSNLSIALKDKGELDEAITVARHAIALDPTFVDTYTNLGNALKDAGQLDEAVDAYRQVITLRPSESGVHSNLVYTLLFHPGYDAKAVAQELRQWNERHAKPLVKLIPHHSNDRDTDRRLRIGYVSPDFRQHVVGQNLLPLLEQHDHQQFEIFCYANVAHPDGMTQQLRQNADHWRNIVGLTDEQAAAQIREDRIDILVDLSLHMCDNRLLIFARKPAPVQATYLGYCGSTGMDTIDYRLSDPYLDPADADLSWYTEKTLRLPRTYWCYHPNSMPDPSSPPTLANGFVTFGCLNNFAKASPPALDLWARILAALPNSRIIIHSCPGKHLIPVIERFERAGVAKDRLVFVGKQTWDQYVQTYSRIDIALDPFPYGGGITTCDALRMGVPVVTLSGQTAVGRGARSILCNMGLPELVAFTPDQYMQIAMDLAQDQDRTTRLRQTMRERMDVSPLMDSRGFARDIEAAYRQMWQEKCESFQAARR